MQKITKMTPYILLCWLLALISAQAQAVEVEGLYEAELAVISQGRTERRGIIRDALLEVLIKVTGDGNTALTPGIPQILNRSNQYVQQYRYRNEVLPLNSETGLSDNQQYLWVRFDKQALDKLMRELSLPIWGRSRPSTLVWLAIEKDGQRELLSGSDDNEISQQVLKKAARRGIPLALPLLDLEDQKKISVTDVLGGFQETILNASQRYAADAVLVGRIRDLGNERWQSRWTLTVSGREYNWTDQGDFDAVINFGVDGAASTLAQNFVRLPSNIAGEVMVLVTDIFNIGDYARSDRFLAGLDGVIRVVPVTIQQEDILYKITLRGDQQSLLQAVRLSSQSILVVAEKPLTNNNTVISTAAVAPAITFKLLQ